MPFSSPLLTHFIMSPKLRWVRPPLPIRCSGLPCRTDRFMLVRDPEVVPVITMRPPDFRHSRLSSQTSAPTTSNTRSTPFPSVNSMMRSLTLGVSR